MFSKKKKIMKEIFSISVTLSYRGGEKCRFTSSWDNEYEAQQNHDNYMEKLGDGMIANNTFIIDSVGIRGGDLQYFLVEKPKKVEG